MTVEKPMPKVTTSTTHKKSKQCDQPIRITTITRNLLKACEKSRVQGAFGFAFHCMVEKLA